MKGEGVSGVGSPQHRVGPTLTRVAYFLYSKQRKAVAQQVGGVSFLPIRQGGEPDACISREWITCLDLV